MFLFKLIIFIIGIVSLFFLIKNIFAKKAKLVILNVLILFIVGFILFFCIDPSKHRGKEFIGLNAHVLKVGVEGAYYPWNYVTSQGDPQGFDIDVARELAKRMHSKVKFIITPWDSLIPNLMNGQTDMIVSSLSITNERAKQVDFSIPYAQVLASFFGKNNNFNQYKDYTINQLKSVLKDKVIGVQSGTTFPQYLSETFKNNITLKYYNNQSQLMMEVNSGRIDAGFSEIVAAQDFMKNNKIMFFGPKLGINDSPLFGKGIAIAVSKGNKILLNKINKELLSMSEDGTIKALSIKYFGTDVSYKGKK